MGKYRAIKYYDKKYGIYYYVLEKQYGDFWCTLTEDNEYEYCTPNPKRFYDIEKAKTWINVEKNLIITYLDKKYER